MKNFGEDVVGLIVGDTVTEADRIFKRELEQQIEDTDNEMLKAANDFVKLGELSAKKEELQKELEHKMDRWMYLEELADKISGNA